MFCVKRNNSPYNLNKIELIDKDVAKQRALDFTKEFNSKMDLAPVAEEDANASSNTDTNTDFLYLRIKRSFDTETVNFEMGEGDGSKYRLSPLKAYVNSKKKKSNFPLQKIKNPKSPYKKITKSNP